MSRVATLIILMAFVLPVFAVTCPPGFNWQRMSGVGCVQSDCAAKGGGYTSTDECWCGENVKACYEFVNYTALGFDPKQCGAFCPISKLIGCADKNGRCPNDKPAQNQTQANATPANSSQKECDVNYCKKYQGPHATSIVMNGYCYCHCEDGYTALNSEIMLCQPTKATCDNYCKQYHGGDKAHGDSAYGTVMGTDCDCHCSPGYVADDTLTCVKANNCKDECLKKMGEGAIATGSYPNCNCDCDKGYTKVYDFENGFKLVCKKIVCPKNSTFDKEKGECVCDEGFYPTPKDGACIKKINNESCGNGHCDTEPKEGAVIEDCEFCPQDCKCGANQVCNVNHPDRTIANWGCISSYAKVIEIGCDNGNKIPTVMLRRAGQDNDTEVGVGVLLNEGDQLTLAGVGKSLSGEAGICTRPYVTLQWGDTKARMFLGSDNPMGSITIKKDAVESGWPSTAEQAGHEAWSAWEILSPLIESTTLHVLHFFTSPDTIAEPDLVRVYVESHILINQSGSGIHIYTLDGGPVVEYKGQNTTVEKGMAVIVNTSGVSTPTNFTASDVGDWYLRVPEQLGGNATAEQSGITLPDFGSIISEFKNTCCGSTAMILGMFLLGAWGSRRVYEKRGERNV